MTKRSFFRTPAEQAAWSAVQERDYDAALDILMDEYGDLVFRLCHAELRGNYGEAQDTLQTVFFEVWRAFGDFRGESSFKTWIYRITRNRCRDRRKPTLSRIAEQSSSSVEQDPIGNMLKDEAADPYQTTARADLRRAVRKSIESVGSQKTRESLFLRFVEGLSFREMAELTGERIETHQMRVQRAYRPLRDRLVRLGVTL